MSTPELMAAAKRCREAAATEADCQLLAAYAASGGRFSDLGGIGIGAVATSETARITAAPVALTAEQKKLCELLNVAPEDFARERDRLRAAGKI